MQILLIVLRGARLHTKAIVSIVINTAPRAKVHHINKKKQYNERQRSKYYA